MNCPHCGTLIVCSACGAAIVEGPRAPTELREEEAAGRESQPEQRPPSDQTFLVVAKGHQDLRDQLEAVVGDFGWVRVIEDRRDDPTLLPRTGREGSVHIDEEIEP